mmetsp:Transcript_37853/g.67638  ORF Transcript_37853/g.67638 Transcript_37853/m.67638 type:complete len:253 (-) Transcript_37853:1367-2125(-)
MHFLQTAPQGVDLGHGAPTGRSRILGVILLVTAGLKAIGLDDRPLVPAVRVILLRREGIRVFLGIEGRGLLGVVPPKGFPVRCGLSPRGPARAGRNLGLECVLFLEHLLGPLPQLIQSPLSVRILEEAAHDVPGLRPLGLPTDDCRSPLPGLLGDQFLALLLALHQVGLHPPNEPLFPLLIQLQAARLSLLSFCLLLLFFLQLLLPLLGVSQEPPYNRYLRHNSSHHIERLGFGCEGTPFNFLFSHLVLCPL